MPESSHTQSSSMPSSSKTSAHPPMPSEALDLIQSLCVWISNCRNKVEIFEKFPGILAEKLKFLYATIERYDPTHDDMILMGYAGFSLNENSPVTMPASRSLSGVNLTGNCITCATNDDLSDKIHFLTEKSLQTRSLVCVPLISSNIKIGALTLGDRRTSHNLQNVARILQIIAVCLAQKLKQGSEMGIFADITHPFQELFESAPIMLYRMSLDGEFLYANKALLKNMGFESLEELRKNVPNVSRFYLNPNLRRQLVEQILDKEGVHRFTVPYRGPNGDVVITDLRAHVVRDRNGKPLYLEGFFENITEQQEMWEALRRSEEKYRELIQSLPIGIYQVALDGTILNANPALARILGYESPQELLEKACNTNTLWPDPGIRKRFIKAYVTTRKPYTFEAELQRKDGTLIVARLHGRFVYDADGSVSHHEGFLEDITEQQRAFNALRENEQRFRNLVETTNDIVWEVDEHIVYTYVSPGVRTMLGYDVEEILGKTPFDLMPPREAERVRRIFEPIAAARRSFTLLENNVVCKSGRVLTLETSGVPFYDSAGNFKGYRGIDRDVTKRKQMEEELRKSHEQLERHVEQRTQELQKTALELKREQQELANHKRILEKMNRELAETNRALSVMAKRMEESKEAAEKHVAVTIRSKVLPIVETLRSHSDATNLRTELDILAAYLHDLSSNVGKDLELTATVSPSELRVAALIKEGLSSKEIARELNVSLDTVKSHRRSLRKKLKLNRKNIDLRVYLESIME